MAGLMRREPRGEVGEFFSRFDRMFDEWARVFPFRAMPFPHWHDVDDVIRVEEFRDDGTLVVRADLPGIDPDKDVELTVSDGMLRIHAERREEDKKEDKGYLRLELRYGSLSRTLPQVALVLLLVFLPALGVDAKTRRRTRATCARNCAGSPCPPS